MIGAAALREFWSWLAIGLWIVETTLRRNRDGSPKWVTSSRHFAPFTNGGTPVEKGAREVDV
jgi:hypothetical protein